MKILLTGANGQLGQSIRSVSGIEGDMDFYYTDIEDLDIANEIDVKNYIQELHPDLLINCSAYTAVDKAETEPELARRINATGPGILAREMQTIGGKMIHISTDYVFNGKKGSEYFEDDTVSPESVYGKTKAEGESLVLKFEENIVIRTSWLYSIYGNNFFKTIIRLMNERDELKIVNDQFGTPTYAADLAGTILLMVKKLKEKNKISGIFHFSNEGETNWFEFAREIQAISKIPCQISGIPSSEYPTAAARPPFSVLNREKIKNTLNTDIPDWRDSLKLCYKKYNNL